MQHPRERARACVPTKEWQIALFVAEYSLTRFSISVAQPNYFGIFISFVLALIIITLVCGTFLGAVSVSACAWNSLTSNPKFMTIFVFSLTNEDANYVDGEEISNIISQQFPWRSAQNQIDFLPPPPPPPTSVELLFLFNQH